VTVLALVPQQDTRTGRDRLEVLTALIGAPSFDPLVRPDIVKVPPNHPVYRWACLAADCERSTIDLAGTADHDAHAGTEIDEEGCA
jgi:hypothetical protein